MLEVRDLVSYPFVRGLLLCAHLRIAWVPPGDKLID